MVQGQERVKEGVKNPLLKVEILRTVQTTDALRMTKASFATTLPWKHLRGRKIRRGDI